MERRTYPRVEVSQPVLYVSDIYPRPKVATTRDLGLEGVRIESLYLLNQGEGLEITIAIAPQVIKCRGKVIHIVWLENGRMEAGIQFEGLSEADRLYLRQHLFNVMEQQALEECLSLGKGPSESNE